MVEVTDCSKQLEELTRAMELRAKEIKMLEMLAMRAATEIQVHRSEDADSIEIGAQSTGRIKVYGDFTKKAEFSRKIKDAIEVLVAAQSAMPASKE